MGNADPNQIPFSDPDPFDPEKLRVPPVHLAGVTSKRLLITVPARKPNKQEWFRVRKELEFRGSRIGIIDFKADKREYLVHPDFANELERFCTLRTIFTAINRDGSLFLWTIPMGEELEWHKSAVIAAHTAMDQWVQVRADLSNGSYIVETSEYAGEPTWPEVSFRELLKLAFKNRFIDSLEHPVVKKLYNII